MIPSETKIAKEAKMIAAIAFRGTEILEAIHVSGRISQAEMKAINQAAVDNVFLLLSFKQKKPGLYWKFVEVINQTIAKNWDDPYSDLDKLRAKDADLKRLMGG